jgi:hypothetical protein
MGDACSHLSFCLLRTSFNSRFPVQPNSPAFAGTTASGEADSASPELERIEALPSQNVTSRAGLLRLSRL